MMHKPDAQFRDGDIPQEYSESRQYWNLHMHVGFQVNNELPPVLPG